MQASNLQHPVIYDKSIAWCGICNDWDATEYVQAGMCEKAVKKAIGLQETDAKRNIPTLVRILEDFPGVFFVTALCAVVAIVVLVSTISGGPQYEWIATLLGETEATAVSFGALIIAAFAAVVVLPLLLMVLVYRRTIREGREAFMRAAPDEVRRTIVEAQQKGLTS